MVCTHLHDWPARHIVDSQEESPKVDLVFSHGEFYVHIMFLPLFVKRRGAMCVGVPYTRRCYARGEPEP